MDNLNELEHKKREVLAAGAPEFSANSAGMAGK
jgi:hypothetical protein